MALLESSPVIVEFAFESILDVVGEQPDAPVAFANPTLDSIVDVVGEQPDAAVPFGGEEEAEEDPEVALPFAPAIERVERVVGRAVEPSPRAEPAAPPAEPEVEARPAVHHARVVIGDGEQRIALSISAHDGHVAIRAHATEPELASAFVAGAHELRDALRRQGLELGDVSTRGQTPSTSDQSSPERDARRREPAPREEPRPPERSVRRRNVRVV